MSAGAYHFIIVACSHSTAHHLWGGKMEWTWHMASILPFFWKWRVAHIQHIFLNLLKNIPYDSVHHLNINPIFKALHLLSMTININYQCSHEYLQKIGFIKWNSCCNFKDKSLISVSKITTAFKWYLAHLIKKRIKH